MVLASETIVGVIPGVGDDAGVGVGEAEGSLVDEDADADGFLSIHWLTGGRFGVRYCCRALSERSDRFGVQTPTRTRHAATSYFACL